MFKELFTDTDVDEFESVVVPDKTQYRRLFKTGIHSLKQTQQVLLRFVNNKATSLVTLKGIRALYGLIYGTG